MRNRRHAPVFFRSAAPPLLNALPPARVATSFTACCCFSRLCCLYIYSYEVAYHLLYLAFLPAVFFIRIQYYAVNFPPWSLGHFVFSCYPASLASEASLPGAPVSFFFRQACALNGCDRRIRPCSISPGTPLPAFFCIKKPHALFGARGFARFRSISLGWDVGDHLRREFRDTHTLHPDLTRALEHCQKQPFPAKEDVLKAPHHLRAVAHRRLI